MRSIRFRCAALLWIVATGSPAFAGELVCPPPDHDRETLSALKAQKFEVSDDARRNALALALVGCLADPDPGLRDGIAYEAYNTWLRAAKLDAATRAALLKDLGAALDPGAADTAGFRQPFAALALAEVARTDRIEAWLTPAQRGALVERAAAYVESVRDYRGFDEKEGWRHGVAHGADLLMQLALNPALDKPQLDRILAAVASQVAPTVHAYVDGESERLARPLLFVAQRGLHTQADWDAWFQRVSAPAPLASWDGAFASRDGLNKRHNLAAFVFAAYVGARESGEDRFTVLLPSLQAAIKALP
jgi:hypothetical protein